MLELLMNHHSARSAARSALLVVLTSAACQQTPSVVRPADAHVFDADAGADLQGADGLATLPEALLGSTLADSPWPSDQFLVEGHVQLAELPLPGKAQNLQNLIAALNELDGFPVASSVFFPTAGAELPAGPLEGTARLIDLTDAEAPLVELSLFYRASTRHLVALAARGHALREGHRYGCVVDDRWVRPGAAMREALAGSGPHADRYAPLVTRLAADGDDLARIGAATIFTVGHPTRRLLTLRAALDERPPPTASDVSVLAGAAIDDLLGSSTSGRSGLGDATGLRHDSIGRVIRGTFDAPYYLAESPASPGRITWDAQGKPVVKGSSAIPFTLVLPQPPAGGYGELPVMIFQHGLNAGMTQVLAVADDYARAGYATIGIDALWHGNRRPGNTDEEHNFTGAPGADGFADESALGALLLFFDITGNAAAGVDPLDGRYVRDNFHQAVIDISQLVRLVRQGDLGAIRAADPALAALSLDGSSLIYTGESFGSLLGAQVLAVEPGLQAGVLAVGGAGIFVPIFACSPFFADLVALLLRTSFDSELDLSRPLELPGEAQLSLALMQAAIEPGDPVAFAPLIATPPAAGKPKSLLMLHAYSDEALPNQAGDALAALTGATAALIPDRTRALRFVDLPTAPLPIHRNRDGATVVVASFDPATHIMFTRFADERKLEPGFPPVRELAEPQPVDNPIELLHDITVEFARSFRLDGVPTVRLP